MFDALPQEIKEDILSQLPAKLLVQFRCVSKAWGSLISSPSFQVHHRRKYAAVQDSGLLLFKVTTTSRRDRYLLGPQDFFPPNFIGELRCRSFENILVGAKIVGSWNGVLCLVNDYCVYNRTFLWNPSIRKCFKVPTPGPCDHFLSNERLVGAIGLGFGCDVTNDLKIVRIAYYVGLTIGLKDCENSVLIQIFSLRSGDWTMVANDLKYLIGNDSSSASAFLNGACHWVASTPPTPTGDNNVRYLIVVFDLNRWVFGEMAVPDCLASDLMNMTVMAFDGSLFLVPFNQNTWYRRQRSIWKMKEYGVAKSWTEIFSIDGSVDLKRFVAFMKNGDVLLERNGGNVVLYNPETREISDYAIWGKEWYVDTYMESLVLMSSPNNVLQDDASMTCYRKRRRKWIV